MMTYDIANELAQYIDHSDLNRRVALIAFILLILTATTIWAYLTAMYLMGRW